MDDTDDPTAAAAADLTMLEGYIRRVKLSVASNEEIKLMAQPVDASGNPIPITHGSQLHDNPYLGLPLQVGSCESCGATQINKCQGHFGFIQLPAPIYHPSHVAELGKILNVICLCCLRLKKPKKGTGKESKFTSCSYCQDLPPLCVTQVQKSNGARGLELKAPLKEEVGDGFWSFLDQFGFHTRRASHRRPLHPKEVQNIMHKISQETRTRLAARGYNLQDGFVMNYMCVPPNCLHIPNLIDDSTGMCPPDTSKGLLRKVLSTIEQIRSSSISHPNFEACEIGEDDLQVAVADYINMGGTAKGSFTRQPAPKQWHQKMKALFISKSSSFSCRAVITGDPYIPLDVVGVPDEVARRMSVQEHITDHNIARLQDMMDKGLCLTYTDVNSNTYDLDGEKGNKRRTMLRVGETVDRRVLDGDIVFLNRPPSTDMHSIQALYVHVHDDHTIKINPLICGPLGADFDGDCVHIFFPRSVSARVEATELFAVENQLVNSHNAKLNFQIKNDYLLALKIMCGRTYSRKVAGQIAMFSEGMIPPHDHYWTIPEILQTTGALTTLPSHPIPNKESVGTLVTAIISSTLQEKDPREAIKLLNLLQPLLMESLLMDGFSISLKDFGGPSAMQKTIQCSSVDLDKFRESTVDFIAHSSSLGLLVDLKSDSDLKKLVEQIGFLGHQLHNDGRLYSSNLVEDCYRFLNKCSRSTKRYDPLQAQDIVRSSFYTGLNPHQELLHSISVREKIERSSSKGLAEPGNLFKNTMAILRDVIVCYDGTIRSSCSNSILLFNPTNVSSSVTPGDPVGILAATAVANAAYKAVLDPNHNNVNSWDSMKEVLLTKASSTNAIDQKAILYLNKCFCGFKFCMERAALKVQSCLRRVKLEDCATEVSIKYQQEVTRAAHCLVGHIHLEKDQLNQMEIAMGNILQTCQEVISKHVNKSRQLKQILKTAEIISSEYCLCDQDVGDEQALQVSCLQFFVDASTTTGLSESTVIQMMTNTIFPILLDTIIKGDPRVQEAKVLWIEPESTCWVQNSTAEQKGELALEITVEKAAAAESGSSWGIAMDACIPVMDLIDTTRSTPYNIQKVQQVFGISCAFDRITQHLSKAIGKVTKSVLKKHLTTIGSSMTCTGSLHGFNNSGYKATFQSLKVQAPFMDATLSRSMQCFRKGAEKITSDQLDSVVSTCSWGKHAAIGTGSAFEIHWNNDNKSASSEVLGGYGLYDFLAIAGAIGDANQKKVTPRSSCLYEVDQLPEDEVQEDEMLCLGGMRPISWTDEPKAYSPPRDSMCRRTVMHSTAQEHQVMQNNSYWSSVANRRNNKPKAPPNSASPGSTSARGWNKRRFTGKVFERKEPKHSWSPAATHQDDKLSWCRQNVAGTQNFAIEESSNSGGWNRKNSGFGQSGGRGMWKPEGAHHGGSNSRNFAIEESSKSGGWNKKNSGISQGGGRGMWKPEGSQRGGRNCRNFAIEESSNSGGWNRKNSGIGQGGGRGMWKPEGSHRGGSNGRNWRAQNNNSARQRGTSHSFTQVEQKIYAQVEPIMKNVKRIIRESRDGMKLSRDDEMFVVNNVLMYHPEKEKKMGSQGTYIMVARHQTFHSSRCLYVASSDGSSSDFSYKKCLENFIRIHYPDAADSFCRKYFK